MMGIQLGFSDYIERAERAPSVRRSRTSREAAAKIAPSMNRLQAELLDFMISRGERGATDEEAQDGSGMAPNTQRPRRRELLQKGLIVAAGEVRPTKSGRSAQVYRVTTRGREHGAR